LERPVGKKEILQKEIKKIFYDNMQVYGSYRVKAELERINIYISRSYVARIMQEMGLKSVICKKFKITTTDSNHGYPIAENILNRNFNVKELGKVWVSDITYIKVAEGWAYLTVVIDLADRKVVGWSLSDDMTFENTVLKAWIMARNNRQITNDFIFHSDRGSQYACNKMKSIFSFYLKNQSMSRKGNCWDNAVAESFFKTIKYENLYRYKFSNTSQLYEYISCYIKWYNTKRLHSSLGYMSPLEKEIEIKYKLKNVA
jgi:transposase InsO family protein